VSWGSGTAAADRSLPVVTIDSGWDFRVFEVAGRWMVRVPRSDQHARRMAVELDLLPAVADRVECRVPAVLATGSISDQPFMLYERIPGRAMRHGDDMQDVGRFLRGLWSTPPSADLPDATGERRAFLEVVGREVLPLLPADLRGMVEADLGSEPAVAETGVVIHHDLGPDHVLFDDEGRLTGVIDFTDAAVGNPNVDLIGVLIAAGEDAVQTAARVAGIEPDWDFIQRYWRSGPLHEVVYGLGTERDELVAAGIAGARRRYGVGD
jgi:aminoglycoside phosphotransferase (APT) family kinase protein